MSHVEDWQMEFHSQLVEQFRNLPQGAGPAARDMAVYAETVAAEAGPVLRAAMLDETHQSAELWAAFRTSYLMSVAHEVTGLMFQALATGVAPPSTRLRELTQTSHGNEFD
jgi:hypothetical protein